MAEVLVRAADAGDTYVAWRWLDELDNPRAERLDTSAVDAAINVLDDALIALRSNESDDEAHDRAMKAGAFVSHDREQALSRQLATAILPLRLTQEILEKSTPKEKVRVRLTPSPRLARIPWETVALDGGTDQRLLDVADIVYDPPATVRAERSVQPEPWSKRASLSAIFVIDPVTRTNELKPILVADADATDRFKSRVACYLEGGVADRENALRAVGQRVTRGRLREWLQPPRSRLFYFGHVSSLPEEPGSASLHISDERQKTWGMASPVGSHLPLSALDLLLGTTTAPPEERMVYGSPEPLAGHQIWPMPPRVAIIACEGGADFRSTETFGLVIAMLNAGAELVTTTRWTMPTDLTFWKYYKSLEAEKIRPTTDFALEVDAAHASADPIGQLADWQRRQLELWRRDKNVANSPLVWASLINTWAPATTENL